MSDDWKVSVRGAIDSPEDCDIKIRVPEDRYSVETAEEIAETILRFVKQQRKKLAELTGVN